MPDDIHVISSELDGAELRREKRKSPRYSRCDGKADDELINEAIQGHGMRSWSWPAEAWERIFGGKR